MLTRRDTRGSGWTEPGSDLDALRGDAVKADDSTSQTGTRTIGHFLATGESPTFCRERCGLMKSSSPGASRSPGTESPHLKRSRCDPHRQLTRLWQR